MPKLSFHTSKISFSTNADLTAFTQSLADHWVHPTDFLTANGDCIIDAMQDEPFNGNRLCGSQIEFDINYDELTVIMMGKGGLKCRKVEKLDGRNFGIGNAKDYFCMSDTELDLMRCIFTADFSRKQPGFEIFIESTGKEDFSKNIKIISLDKYYSKEAYEKRLNKLNSKIQKTNIKLTSCNLAKRALESLLDELNSEAHQCKCLIDQINENDFDSALNL